jgi:hypothetical protein
VRHLQRFFAATVVRFQAVKRQPGLRFMGRL